MADAAYQVDPKNMKIHSSPRVRRWDLASTLPTHGKDPDYTAGLLATVKNGCFYVLDVEEETEVDRRIKHHEYT